MVRATPCLHLLLVGHVHGHGEGLERTAEFCCDCIGRRLVQVGDHDAGAFARIGSCDLFADSAGGAGHDRNFVLETHVTQLLRWRAASAGSRLAGEECR